MTIKSRPHAGVADIPVEAPENDCGTYGTHHSPSDIGGCYGVGWNEYFEDVESGELYYVACSDGVYYSKGPHHRNDIAWAEDINNQCKSALEQVSADSALVRLPKKWAVVAFVHISGSVLDSVSDCEAWDEYRNNLRSGGLIGHCNGVPIYCDPEIVSPQFPPRPKLPPMNINGVLVS